MPVLAKFYGIIIRMSASQINTVSRTSKGVRVMRLSENEKVVSITKASRYTFQADLNHFVFPNIFTSLGLMA